MIADHGGPVDWCSIDFRRSRFVVEQCVELPLRSVELVSRMNWIPTACSCFCPTETSWASFLFRECFARTNAVCRTEWSRTAVLFGQIPG